MELMNRENMMQRQDQEKSVTAEAMISRQAQEVQAAMVVAKRFPRDEFDAYNRIMKACSRPSLAEAAMYEYPRGGQKVTGPSIRLAEAIAQAWGNMDSGVVELEQKSGESTMMAYAWDLETNTRNTKIFTVKHERKAKGKINQLDDPRDIYEMTANQGARRVRSCILATIPGDVIEAAVEKCKETLVSGHTEPLQDRVKKVIAAFETTYQVSKEAIEKYIGCSAHAFTEQDLIRLKNVGRSLRDGMAKREDYFEIDKPKSEQSPLNQSDKPESKPDPKPEKKPNTKSSKEDEAFQAEMDSLFEGAADEADKK